MGRCVPTDGHRGLPHRSPDSPPIPFGPGGLSGFVVYQILQRVLSEVETMTHTRGAKMPDVAEMMKTMTAGMPWMGPPAGAPVENVPQDLTKGQYTILKVRRQGHSKPKDIAKSLSMDKREVEKEIDVLKAHGYLTKEGKLTSKALET